MFFQFQVYLKPNRIPGFLLPYKVMHSHTFWQVIQKVIKSHTFQAVPIESHTFSNYMLEKILKLKKIWLAH